MRHDTIGRPMEILLVEDDQEDASLTFEFLREGQVQHRLTWLRDGDEATEFLYRRGKFARAPRPDLILLDLGLPKKDGREVLTDIKSDEELSRIPVVVMTASKDHEDMLKSEFLQVEGYITKPVDLDKFIWLVHELRRFWHADLILPTA
jgi:two-component system response regulator